LKRLYLRVLARLSGKKKRPSRESRTPRVLGPGESNTKEEYIFNYIALSMPKINVIIFQLVINFSGFRFLTFAPKIGIVVFRKL
jgi:hypothetical protein